MRISPIIPNRKNLTFNANKMSKSQAQYFKDRFKEAKYADIVCHELTDRDAINSAITIQRYLNTKNIPSRIIISQNLQKIGIKEPDFQYIQADEIKKGEKPKDMVVCVDFSAKERVNSDTLNFIKQSPNIVCIDHHRGVNLFSKDYLVIKKSLENADEIIHSAVPCYVDSSAKSATSIIYRFLEAIDEPITNEQAYSMMFGFADDSIKRGLIKSDGIKGTLSATDELKKDKNAYEIYQNLKSRLNDEQIKKIAQATDIMSNLTAEEKEFYDSLHDKLKFSNNGKIAYIEIPPDDKEWKKLGSDNSRTSTILNRFRQNVQKNDFNDTKLNNVEIVMAFYEANGDYRFSAHSKKYSLENFIDYVDLVGEMTQIKNIENMLNGNSNSIVQEKGVFNFNKKAGGHPDRAGGKLEKVTDKDECHNWVQSIIACDDFFNKDYPITRIKK